MEKQKIDRYSEQLTSASKHCLRSLLDYADALKKNESDQKVNVAIESLKQRMHNDIPALHQRVSNLLILALMGGEIQPLGTSDGNNHKS
ncbi:MAG: hypothetical protein NTY10_04340 [Candidatus Omnitrophica bacterium]|nr:hypothetical protein [Candidatus Omnitrophota bacterium]